jgi:hypothetical protein
LLAALAEGDIEPGMAHVLELTDKLEVELPHMIAEHEEIVTALQRLEKAAQAESKPEHARFAHKLMAHGRIEEEVSYPAAILIGRYLKAMLPGPDKGST